MKSHTMTFDLNKKYDDDCESLGELLTKAVIRMSGREDKRAARFVVEFAARAVCEAIIRNGDHFLFWKLPELLRVDLTANGDDSGDWWKQSRDSRN